MMDVEFDSRESGVIDRRKPIPLAGLRRIFSYYAKDDVPSVTPDSRKREYYEQGWERWQAVRLNGAIFGDAPATGFEPYLLDETVVDSCGTVDSNNIAAKIYEAGKDILEGLKTGVDYSLRRQIYNTLTGETPTLTAVIYLNRLHGASLAEFRAQMHTSPRAESFRQQTEFAVRQAYRPHVYTPENFEIYSVPKIGGPKINFGQSKYPPFVVKDPSHGYGFIANLGKIGAPNIRSWLDFLPFDAYMDLEKELVRHLR